jgi:hypothetical protein
MGVVWHQLALTAWGLLLLVVCGLHCRSAAPYPCVGAPWPEAAAYGESGMMPPAHGVASALHGASPWGLATALWVWQWQLATQPRLCLLSLRCRTVCPDCRQGAAARCSSVQRQR